jgi:hypothetical protein
MAFTEGQLVHADDLNNFSVTSVTTSGDVTVGDDLAVTDDATVGGDLTVTGSLSVGGQNVVGITKDTCCGRLTLTSGVPVTSADVTAAATLYWALYKGNEIALYNGTAWEAFSVAELSIASPASANQMYDVFVNYNAGTPVLAVTAWTNDTTRATALTTQDGILVKTGAAGQRYVGSVRTVSASQINDSIALRHVWNYYHRVEREMRVLEATNSWNYTLGYRQANGAATNQLDFVVGVSEDVVTAEILVTALATGQADATVAIGIDSTSVPAANCLRASSQPASTVGTPVCASLRAMSAVGRHTWVWLEAVPNPGGGVVVTWYGDNGATILQSGIHGTVLG